MFDHQDKMLSEKKRKDLTGQCVWYVIICLKGGKATNNYLPTYAKKNQAEYTSASWRVPTQAHSAQDHSGQKTVRLAFSQPGASLRLWGGCRAAK